MERGFTGGRVLLCLLALALAGAALFGWGYVKGREDTRKTAVKVELGRWTPGPDGQAYFEWVPPVKVSTNVVTNLTVVTNVTVLTTNVTFVTTNVTRRWLF